MRVVHAFAGLVVADRDRAVAWYGRLMGRPPDMLPNPSEATWQVGDTVSLYVVASGDRPGGGVVTLIVDDLDADVADIGARGVTPDTVEDMAGVGRKAVFTDPDGNTVALAELSSPSGGDGWAGRWQRAWDRLQDRYIGDRDTRIAAVLDVVEAVGGPAPLVLDLACGTGTLTRRLLDRLPGARAIGVDIDPVLLTIASATFADDQRVRVVTADLTDPLWADVLTAPGVDAVMTATALHWLPGDVVERLYRDLAGLVRPGGVFVHAEQMSLSDVPRVGTALAGLDRRDSRDRGSAGPDWDEWWDRAAADPLLRDAAARRREIFPTAYPTEEFSPPAEWHADALRRAGFAEAGVVWRSRAGAVIAAVR